MEEQEAGIRYNGSYRSIEGPYEKKRHEQVPLETTEHHRLSLQKSSFGNEATKDSLHQCGSHLKRGHFNEQVPLYLPCGPIQCSERVCSGGQEEAHLKSIY